MPKIKPMRYIRRDAAQLEELLAVKYAAPQYAFFAQVRNCTGAAVARTADGLALGLWPSRGIHLHGFEIKVDRGDWLKELKQPEKAEDICQFCDNWWVVVSDGDIVREGELPNNWGLLVASGNGLRTKREAPQLDSRPLDKDMIAGILRKASEAMVSTVRVQPMIEAARKQATDAAEKSGNYQHRQLREAVDEFEKESGIKITDRWHAGNIGAEVKFLLKHGMEKTKSDAESLLKTCKRIESDVEKCLAAMNGQSDESDQEDSL